MGITGSTGMLTGVTDMMDEVLLSFAIAWIAASLVILSICMYRYYVKEYYKK
jgi:hypothetical protein